MSTTSKSPRKILIVAYQVAVKALPAYAHRFSPKTYIQHQLFACLVLKMFLKIDFRGLEQLLIDLPELCEAIQLEQVPDHSTLHRAEKRLLRCRLAASLLSETLQAAIGCRKLRRRVGLAALDGTGFETRHISGYFVRRRKRGKNPDYQTTTYTRYPYVGILCDTASHLILSAVPERGPGSDVRHFRQALDQALGRIRIEALAADAGYDGEAIHGYARDRQVRTIIPATKGRPTRKLPRSRWRRLMSTRFNRTKYGQRWQVETVNSMIKRLQGSALRARRYWSQCREIMLKVITHNIMILRQEELCDRADLSRLIRLRTFGV